MYKERLGFCILSLREKKGGDKTKRQGESDLCVCGLYKDCCKGVCVCVWVFCLKVLLTSRMMIRLQQRPSQSRKKKKSTARLAAAAASSSSVSPSSSAS